MNRFVGILAVACTAIFPHFAFADDTATFFTYCQSKQITGKASYQAWAVKNSAGLSVSGVCAYIGTDDVMHLEQYGDPYVDLMQLCTNLIVDKSLPGHQINYKADACKTAFTENNHVVSAGTVSRATSGPKCGDGVCQVAPDNLTDGENCFNCPQDCAGNQECPAGQTYGITASICFPGYTMCGSTNHDSCGKIIPATSCCCKGKDCCPPGSTGDTPITPTGIHTETLRVTGTRQPYSYRALRNTKVTNPTGTTQHEILKEGTASHEVTVSQ